MAALSREKCKGELRWITADGTIDDSEINDFVDIQNALEKISITVEALQLWSEQMVANGTINMEKYEASKNRK